MTVLVAAFGLCWLLVLWPYFGYPLLLRLLPGRAGAAEAAPAPVATTSTDLPEVDVVMAAFNEAAVLERKVRSVFASAHPAERIHLWVGLDACTDDSWPILEGLLAEFPNLHAVRFVRRTGKPAIINHLVAQGRSPYVLGTDANVLFLPDTIPNLLRAAGDPRVHLVGGNLIYRGPEEAGIAGQERSYLGFENALRARESARWNLVAGVEGGCYLMRRHAWQPVPPGVVVDDFYLTMKVLERGGWVRFAPQAVCTEDVSTRRWVEFRRKTRIARGNFLNLRLFLGLFLRRFRPLGFAVISHKVLRWTAPLFAAFSVLLAVPLMGQPFFQIFLLLAGLGLVVLTVDAVLPERVWRPGPVRSLCHFALMNVALMVGLHEFLRGDGATTWQPTQREQQQ